MIRAVKNIFLLENSFVVFDFAYFMKDKLTFGSFNCHEGTGERQVAAIIIRSILSAFTMFYANPSRFA